MVIFSKNRGFSLTEILISTIVMSMIMVGVLGFVKYGGDTWQKGQTKINVQNYNDMAFQLLKDDLLQASKIISPKNFYPDKSKVYKSITYELVDNAGNKKRYKVRIASGTLQREIVDTTKKAVAKKRPLRLARNARAFFVYRLSKSIFEVSLQIQAEKNINPDYEDTDSADYDSDENLSLLNISGTAAEPEILSSESMVLLAPGVE